MCVFPVCLAILHAFFSLPLSASLHTSRSDNPSLPLFSPSIFSTPPLFSLAPSGPPRQPKSSLREHTAGWWNNYNIQEEYRRGPSPGNRRPTRRCKCVFVCVCVCACACICTNRWRGLKKCVSDAFRKHYEWKTEKWTRKKQKAIDRERELIRQIKFLCVMLYTYISLVKLSLRMLKITINIRNKRILNWISYGKINK